MGNSFSGIDNLTWVHDRHTFKAGVEIRHIQLNQEYGQHGTLTFSSVENLADNVVTKATLTGALPVNHLRKNDYFLYAQDEYKWRPNLILNLGVRYTIFDLFHEEHGMANPFDFATCGAQGFCGVGASFGQQNYGDVDPRVAFAWTPRKGGQTVIRGGFGIYHEDGQLDDQNLPAKNEVPSYSATSSSSSPLSYCPPSTCPTAVPFGAGTLSPNAEQRNRKDTYVEQWSFSAQRELPANFVGTVSYLGSHGVHLLETNVVNVINSGHGLVQYPAFAPAIGWRGSVGMSTYNGLSVAMRRPFSHGLLVAANYMWSHEIDNGSNGSGDGDEMDPQNPLCQACDTRQRRLGRPPCGQWQCGLSTPLRPGQTNAEPARDCQRHCGRLGTDHNGAGSHRLPGECADAHRATSRRMGPPARSVLTWSPASRSLRREAER